MDGRLISKEIVISADLPFTGVYTSMAKINNPSISTNRKKYSFLQIFQTTFTPEVR